MSNETELSLIKLGLYQIIGGAIGFIVILLSVLKSLPMAGLAIFLYLFIILLFAYSIFCGILCIKANRHALAFSMANQIFQVIGFAIVGFTFKYVAGVYCSIALDLTNDIKFGISAGFSKFTIDINKSIHTLEVNFNLVAFAVIYWIEKLKKKVQEDAAVRIAASIGNVMVE